MANTQLDTLISRSIYSEETLAGVSVEELLAKPPVSIIDHVACAVALIRYAIRYNLPLPCFVHKGFAKPPETMLPFEQRLYRSLMDESSKHHAYMVAAQTLWQRSYEVATGIISRTGSDNRCATEVDAAEER